MHTWREGEGKGQVGGRGQPILPSHSHCHPDSRAQWFSQLEDREALLLGVRRQVLESEMQSVVSGWVRLGITIAGQSTDRRQHSNRIGHTIITHRSQHQPPRVLCPPAYLLTKTPLWFPTNVAPWYLPFGIQMCSETGKAGKGEGISGSPPSSQGQGHRDADVSSLKKLKLEVPWT